MKSGTIQERSLHDNSSAFVQKRQDHLSQSMPGIRVYPYPGTAQEAQSYHGPPQPVPHMGSVYMASGSNINSPHPTTQVYRDRHYQLERQDYERYQSRRAELSEQSSNRPQHSTQARRRPSLLPPSSANDYMMNSSVLSSSFQNRVERDRYFDHYRYSPYDNNGTKSGLPPSSLATINSLNMNTVTSSHHAPVHLQHGIPVHSGHHQVGLHSSPHIAQPHLVQETSDLPSQKRPRLSEARALHQPLIIDTRDVIEIKKEPAYNPQVEAISPTLPNEDTRQDMSPLRSSKDELLQSINKIDREIVQTESQINKFRKKQQDLIATSKSSIEKQDVSENLGSDNKQLSIAQIIYSENKKKTQQAHTVLEKLGPQIELPLYNQPSDNAIYLENKNQFLLFKKRLLLYFKKRHQEKQAREKYLTQTYEKMMQIWLKKLEKKETVVVKKAKDAKMREYFEKQFPELKKQREDKERFSRVGQRIRSDAELEEIMDGLQEQELEDKKMRSYAVIPPIIMDSRHKQYRFINKNGLIEDPLNEFKERQMLNVWTEQEKDIFRERFLQHPKNFGVIANYIERKTSADCVQYYYLSKKSENYKQQLRKHVKKRTRALVKAQQQQQQQHQQHQQQQQQQQQLQQNQQQLQAEKQISTSTGGVVTTKPQNVSANTLMKKDDSVKPAEDERVEVSKAAFAASIAGTLQVSSISASVLNGPDLSDKSQAKESNEVCEGVCDNEDYKLMEDGPHRCCVCDADVENFSKSRSVNRTNFQIYGISSFKPGLRICMNCHFKNMKRTCPFLSCKTPRRKLKRLKMLPPQWFALPEDSRHSLAKELDLPGETTTACPRCVMRLSRRIGAVSPSATLSLQNQNTENISWSDKEIELLKKGLFENGKNWNVISSLIATKTVKECRMFYFNYKYKLNLDQLVKSYNEKSSDSKSVIESDSEEYWNELSDSEETSSAEEGNGRCTSDTASAPSPLSKNIDDKEFEVVKSANDKAAGETSQPEFSKLQDYKSLSASQGSLKSDYDSSATMSADEGQGNGDNERQSSPIIISQPPRANSAMPTFPPSNHILFQHHQVDRATRPASHDAAFSMMEVPNKLSTTAITSVAMGPHREKVPSFLINPNAPSTQQTSRNSPLNNPGTNKEEPTCVRDLIYQAIEMSLQSPMKGGNRNPNSTVLVTNNPREMMNNTKVYSPDIKNEQTTDMRRKIENPNELVRQAFQNSSQRPEGLAMMASYHSQHLTSQTPETDYEVQDLSKKDKRGDYSPPRGYNGSSVKRDKPGVIRGDYGGTNAGGPQSFAFVAPPPAHSNQSRTSTPVSEVLETRDYSSYRQTDTSRTMKSGYMMPEKSSSMPSLANPLLQRSNALTSINQMKGPGKVPVPTVSPLIASKVMSSQSPSSQLSPKLAYKDFSAVSSSGGSITQGTPIIMQSPSNSRFEGLLRQLPKTPNKEGSITLGTPMPLDNSRRKPEMSELGRNEILPRPGLPVMYDPATIEQYYRRSSPSSIHSYVNSGMSHLPTSQSSPHMPHSSRAPFHNESQLSSKQIMIDFNTSKQMLTRRSSGSSDKDRLSPLPGRNSDSSNSPQPNSNRISLRPYGAFSPNVNPGGPAGPHVYLPEGVYSHEGYPVPEHRLTGPDVHSSTGQKHAPSPTYQQTNRQNVIQHWNTPMNKPSVIQTSKSSSPRNLELRTEVISPPKTQKSTVSPRLLHTGYSPHDAFTTLVNAAAAQQSVPVPGKEDRRSSLHLKPEIVPPKERPNVEGLEKSLMEMHQRPRSFSESTNQRENEMRMKPSFDHANEPEVAQYKMSRIPTSHVEHIYMNEQKRRQEYEPPMNEADRYRLLYGDHAMSRSSLRYSGIREPFSREQFERELRQETSRRLNDGSYLKKNDEVKEPSLQQRTERTANNVRIHNELDNEASKLFSQSFQKDNSAKTSPSNRGFTAANLIDAIITHQINQSAENVPKPPTTQASLRPIAASPHRESESFTTYAHHEKVPAHANREEIVTISDSPGPERTSNTHPIQPTLPTSENYSSGLTLGEHIATIISKNYSDKRPPYFEAKETGIPTSSISTHVPTEVRHGIPGRILEGIAAAAVSGSSSEVSSQHSSWKLRQALQPDKDVKESEERQIMKITRSSPSKEHITTVSSQTPTKNRSPISQYNVEPISPPIAEIHTSVAHTVSSRIPSWVSSNVSSVPTSTMSRYHVENSDSSMVTASHSSSGVGISSAQNQPLLLRLPTTPINLSPLDYVKNRIVEVMRTTADETSEDKRSGSDSQTHHENKGRNVESTVIKLPETKELGSQFKIETRPLEAKLDVAVKRPRSTSPTTSEAYPKTSEEFLAKRLKLENTEMVTSRNVESSQSDRSAVMQVSSMSSRVYSNDDNPNDKTDSDSQKEMNNNVGSSENISNVSNGKITSTNVEVGEVQSNESEVSSLTNMETGNDKSDRVSQIYADSPSSPGEMVIDESVTNNPSSSSPSHQRSNSPSLTSQYQITTSGSASTVNLISEEHKPTISISSSSEVNTHDIEANQSHSVSSSVTSQKSKDTSLQITTPAPDSKSSTKSECSPSNSNNVSSSNANSNTDMYYNSSSPSSSGNSVAPDNGTANPPSENDHGENVRSSSSSMPENADSSQPCLSDNSTRSSTVLTTVQSSTISASGTASSTATNLGPQYEPLSDDE